MRLLMLLLVACGGPAPQPPAPVHLVDRTAEFGLPLRGAPCAAAADLDGDGRVDLVTADSDDHDRTGQLYILAGGSDHAVTRSSPTASVVACAASPAGRLAVAGREGIWVDGVKLDAPGRRKPTLLWLDDQHLLIGSDGADDGPGITLRCTPRPFTCEFHGLDTPTPIGIWDDGAIAWFPFTARLNGASLTWWNGRAAILLSEDFGPSRVIDRGTFEVITTLATYGGMGAAQLDERIYVADFGTDALFDATGSRTDVQGSSWHSGWSPVIADFNGDGKLDVFVASPMSARTPDDFIALFGDGTPRLSEDVILLRPDLVPQHVPHRTKLPPSPSLCATAWDGGRRLLIACNVLQGGASEIRLLDVGP